MARRTADGIQSAVNAHPPWVTLHRRAQTRRENSAYAVVRVRFWHVRTVGKTSWRGGRVALVEVEGDERCRVRTASQAAITTGLFPLMCASVLMELVERQRWHVVSLSWQ